MSSYDWAYAIRELVDVHHPKAEKVVLVMDNRNIHGLGSLDDAFPAVEAKRIVDRLEVHRTPKHGNWLNMAEIELSVLSRQCPKQRIPTTELLWGEVSAWEARRNGSAATIDWRFTTADARIKLKRLYPTL